MNSSCWVDGQACSNLPLDDRGLAYGHGLFETMRLHQKFIISLPEHLHRLYSDAPRIGLNLPPVEAIHEFLATALAGTASNCSVVKLIATAGSGGRGYRSPRPGQARIIIRVSARIPPTPADPVRVRLCSTHLVENPRLAGIKHLNRLQQVLARDEWEDPEIHEGLMLDSRGYLIEATQANVFLLRGDCLITPDLARCGVRGVMRGRVLQTARQMGLPVQVTDITAAEISQCCEMFLSNAIMGIVSVQRYRKQWFRQTRCALRLRKMIEAANSRAYAALPGRAGNNSEASES